jgi:membrane protein YqaA with SNARE-associated domain
MVSATLGSLIISLLEYAIIYFVGKILCQPTELRVFLGLKKKEENLQDIYFISKWIETIGWFLKIIAIIGSISSIASISAILSRIL